LSAGLFVVASVGMLLASHILSTPDRSRQWTFPALVIGSLAALSVGLILEVYGHWSAGLRPTINSFAALTYTASLLQGMLVAPALVIGVYFLARYARGNLDSNRRAVFDVTHLLFQAAVAEGLFNQLLVYGFPHVVR
jgi:cytochrome c oxidase subunit I+III